MKTTIKRKKCRNNNCEALFVPMNSMAVVCSMGCALEFSRTDSGKHYSKAYRKETKEKKAAIKPKNDYLKEAQKAFNSYIRVRDRHKPCVSCDQSPYQGRRNASHFRSVGACSALRFNTFNVHASCSQCNSNKSGNIGEYRIRLLVRVGAPRVEWLECQNDITRYDIDYLKRLTRIFRERAKLASERA